MLIVKGEIQKFQQGLFNVFENQLSQDRIFNVRSRYFSKVTHTAAIVLLFADVALSYRILKALPDLLQKSCFILRHIRDECVFDGQNVFLGPTIHLPCPEYSFESHHSHLMYVTHYYFQMRFQKE